MRRQADMMAMGKARQKQAEMQAKMQEAEKMKCHLHKKPKDNCKFCKKHQEMLDKINAEPEGNSGQDDGKKRRKPDRAISEDPERDMEHGPVELANPKTYGFSSLLQTHIVECAHFKSLLSLDSFEQVVEETVNFAKSVEPYMSNSGTIPSALFCCLYRFFTLNLSSRQLRRLIESQESPYVRCCGLLYVRFGLPHEHLLTWMEEYMLDDEEFQPSQESEGRTTIGDYAESLLANEKYFNAVLPRLPMVTKRLVEEKIAPLTQNRKRMQANKAIPHILRERGRLVECSIHGEWVAASIIDLEEYPPSRPKVRVRLEDGGTEAYIHLGKVILSDRGRRSRSPNRRRGASPDRSSWCYTKGRSDKELLEEMRSRERDKAVCSSGKEYARKPVGYKAACALPREQGAASYKLMEEETFVSTSVRGKRARTPSPERNALGPRKSAEHQARMQQLFEKYGNVKAAGDGQRISDGVERPDVMRLG